MRLVHLHTEMTSPDLRQVTVVLPTKNEEQAVGPVIDEILSVGVPRENVLVVDGYSTDRTREIAQAKGVKVILQEGRGKAAAIATAIKYVNTPWVLIMDCDWTYPAEYIPKLLERALRDDCDEVIGIRVHGRENIPPVFRFGNRVLTWFFNLLFGAKLRDVCSGMYLVRTDILREVNFEMSGFSVEAEIAAHVVSTGGKVCEEPIHYRQRLGEKKLKVWHGLKIFLDMVRLTWRYNPTFLMFFIAAPVFLVGLGLTAYALHMYLQGIKTWVKLLVGLFLTGTGLICTLQAIHALFVKRVEYRLLRYIRSLARMRSR